MEIKHHEHHHHQQDTGHPQNQTMLPLDALYCEEEEEHYWEENGVVEVSVDNNNGPLLFSEQDLFWEDEEELFSLFSKEQEQQQQQVHPTNGLCSSSSTIMDSVLILARNEAVEWMLKAIAFHGFTPHTSILSINYLDRFLSSAHFQKDKPWMIQLLAVTCLSLAAKMEETQVPLLLDLQVEDIKYMFEAKTIKRMELLVLSGLKWRMNPITPLLFLDHMVRRRSLGLKIHLQCQRLLVSVAADSRSVYFLPSILATATMLHVIRQVEPWHALAHQSQLLGVLKISDQEKVNDCYQLIIEISNRGINGNDEQRKKMVNPGKRKYQEIIITGSSPNGVIDLSLVSDESDQSSSSIEDDSGEKMGPSVSSFSSSPEPLLKKKKKSLHV
ncbi:cyclin-D3-2-like isoform X2 [Impatiens glandulifera]|uniref:cyclin-D3-2-like isoform X2 n=1 Tax=Impatiens glandulifera TaxID=253017 RepID=UPI001FB063FF|nr:cyclin-D3-2-like isoform X2 [Impatiens glandulifera]